ncbi:hypothetical protein APS56_11050 [Pseudalgibacter alginicilyticus]|uniref:Alginate lyase domain-containing protein n=1 Tax=Pseudalgibacter alginicilyticus TaxID=1736674 RepID=A0A0N7HYM0_9FLAO|nr:alginate lyase family protein [Pseudalgibacter alginicilyticus]ALJ05630.1 hypothetical protein APS56_11050 [Pseudalgibacter alginicilyticus]
MKVEKFLWIIILFHFLSIKSFSISYIQFDSIALANVKQKLHNGTAAERTYSAYKTLISKADELLSIKNPTVMDKTIIPPSGNKHDYLSIGRYWWPNPDIADGLPWIRKDGKTNPDTQTDAVDRKRLSLMTNAIKYLCLAYYFSENEQYAKKAVSMIKTWFLDDETRMNPHLKFAQSVPGYPNGRPWGILDGRSIPQIIPDAINILSNSKYWNKDQNARMIKWLNDYLTWLTESELGKAEFKQKNNHGSWCKYQVISLALYLGHKTLAKEVIESTMQSLNEQLDHEGKQIHEINRTKSFFYSCFNLDALTQIANLADKIGIDMWNYKTKDGKSLMLAVNYLAPVIKGEAWPQPDIHGINLSSILASLVRMSNHINSNELEHLLSKTMTILIEKEKSTGIKNDKIQALSLIGAI